MLIDNMTLSEIVFNYDLYESALREYDYDKLHKHLETYIFSLNDVETKSLNKLIVAYHFVQKAEDMVRSATSYWLEKHTSPYKKRLKENCGSLYDIICEGMEDIIEIDFERLEYFFNKKVEEEDINEELFASRIDFIEGN